MIFSLFISFCSSYEAFPDGIHTKIISGQAGQSITYFTFYHPFLLSISYIETSKTILQISSPSQKDPIQIGSNRSFYFPDGQTKIDIQFLESSSIILNYATIPNNYCSDGIETIINSTYDLLLDSKQASLDKCFMFSSASEQHSFKVVKNSLQANTSLCLYNDFLGGNAFQCYTEGTAVDDDFRPGSGSKAPWILRIVSSQENRDCSIQIQLKAKLIDDFSNNATSYIGKPMEFKIPETAQYESQWWIPIIGSIPSIFLFASSIATFVLLWRKHSLLAHED